MPTMTCQFCGRTYQVADGHSCDCEPVSGVGAMAIEPAGWAYPPKPVDLTDADLPRHCECGGFLPDPSRWEWEYDEGLVALITCARCKHMTIRRLTSRR